MTLRSFDVVCIGAGPAATGAMAALADDLAGGGASPSVLLIDGAAMDHPALALSALCPQDRRLHWSTRHFGLPAVRAHGDGGSSRLWHGGLFVPYPDDEVVEAQARTRFDLPGGLAALCTSPALRGHVVAPYLQATLAAARQATPGTAWRQVLIPTRPPLLSPRQAHAPLSLVTDPAVVIGLERHAAGAWTIRLVRADGFETVRATRVLLCAGALGSTALLAAAAGLPEQTGGFSDHLHVFVGVLAKRSLPPALHEHLAVRRDRSAGLSVRPLWKTTVPAQAPGAPAIDVSLSFRSVANPDFPRAGRRFGDFVGARAGSRLARVMLGLRNPMTAVEMLAYKHGHEFPFEHLLAHATIAPRQPIGIVSAPAGLRFAPDRDVMAHSARQALTDFASAHALDTSALRLFSHEDVSASLISGAQFCAGATWPARLSEWVAQQGPALRVCDTSAMAYTSIYNQGLLSMIRGYVTTRCSGGAEGRT